MADYLLDGAGRFQQCVTIVTQIKPRARGRVRFAGHRAFPEDAIENCGVVSVGVRKVEPLGLLRLPGRVTRWLQRIPGVGVMHV